MKTNGILAGAVAQRRYSLRAIGIERATKLLAAESAAGVAVIDLTYVAKGGIAPGYLLDALPR